MFLHEMITLTTLAFARPVPKVTPQICGGRWVSLDGDAAVRARVDRCGKRKCAGGARKVIAQVVLDHEFEADHSTTDRNLIWRSGGEACARDYRRGRPPPQPASARQKRRDDKGFTGGIPNARGRN